MKFLRRIVHHSKRFKGELLSASLFSLLFLVLFGAFYPEDTVGDLVDLFHSIGVFGNLTHDAAGWSIWLAIILGMIMSKVTTLGLCCLNCSIASAPLSASAITV